MIHAVAGQPASRWRLAAMPMPTKLVGAGIGVATRRCGVALLLLVVVVVTGCQDAVAPVPGTPEEIYDEWFAPALQRWQAAREAEATAFDAVREEGGRDKPDLLELGARQARLDAAAAERERREREVAVPARLLLEQYPFKYQANRVHTEFLEVLCDDIDKLVQRRIGLRDQYNRPQSHVEHQLLQQEQRSLDEQIARQLTRLQEQFPDASAVRDLDEKVVKPRYEMLMRAMNDIESGAVGRTPGESRYSQVLAELARMKELYPLSNWTRRAEQPIVRATASRNLSDLRGWPAAVFFGCLALLLVGFGRAMAAYMASRQRDEEQASARVFRPAPWVRDPATADETPPPVTRPPTPLLPRRDASSTDEVRVDAVRPPTPRPSVAPVTRDAEAETRETELLRPEDAPPSPRVQVPDSGPDHDAPGIPDAPGIGSATDLHLEEAADSGDAPVILPHVTETGATGDPDPGDPGGGATGGNGADVEEPDETRDADRATNSPSSRTPSDPSDRFASVPPQKA